MLKNILTLSLLSTVIYADTNQATFVNDVAKTTLMGSQKSFESGTHDLKANEEMGTLFVGFRYNFESSSDINFFLNAAAGLAKLENNSPSLGVLGDRSVIESKNLELGGGVRYKINNESYIALGAGVIYSQVDSKFEYNSLTSTANRNFIESFYNQDGGMNAYTYQANIKYDYETNIKGYEPYVTAFLGYYYTDVDGFDETSSSTISHIKVGAYSPELIKIYDLPFKVELYAQETLLMGDIEESMDTKNFTKIGVAFHLYTNTIIKHVDNLYLDLNYVTGDNIEGVHVGVSASF